MKKRLPDELSQMISTGAITVTPNDMPIDLSDSTKYAKADHTLNLMGIAAYLPLMASAASKSGLYTVSMPKGVTGTLVKLKDGGFGSMIRGESGSFIGSASFHPVSFSPAVTALTAMSVVSGQYFLSAINSTMDLINQGIDKILDFLYGDKKAELISEISFIQKASTNYIYLMHNDAQRTATLTNIQAAEKIAMKDIEFYLCDLGNAIKGRIEEDKHVKNLTNNALQICDSLTASLQLYISACILEVYYSQNSNPNFIENMRTDMMSYIDKCHDRMLANISQLRGRIESAEGSGFLFFSSSLEKKPHLNRLSETADNLTQEQTLNWRQVVDEALDSISKETKYLMNESGECYYQIN